MAAESTQTLSRLLEKTGDWDKDERYMATNDLCNELQKDLTLDEAMERRICTAVMQQLDDSSNDVQTIAVKCLGVLLKKVQQAQVGEIGDKLCDLILTGKPELRDIYSIGLKTLVADVPHETGENVAGALAYKLLDGVRSDNADTKQECMDALSDVLRRFGHTVEGLHHDLMTVVLAQLQHGKPIIRKKAAQCLGSLAVASSDALLNQMVETLLQHFEDDSADKRTLIQTIGTVSRTVGFRLGRHLERIIPILLRTCGDPDDESRHTDESNELRENCFPAMESFVLRCPREVAPHLAEIVRVALAFLKYDPNYCYDDDDEQAEDAEDEEEFDDDDLDDDDDDDTSWKVRKSTVKVLSAVITARPEMLQDLYDTCADELISRFREREENVRLDVIACVAALLNATLVSNRSAMSSGSGPPGAAPTLQRQRSAVGSLRSRVPAIMAASQRVINGNSAKSKSAVFVMLRTLCEVLEGGLDEHVAELFEGVKKCIADRSQPLKLDALSFLRSALEAHPAEVLQPLLPGLLEPLHGCVAEEWYKIIAETLRVLGAMAAAARPLAVDGDMFQSGAEGFSHSAVARPLYDAVLPRLQAHDLDQEIKECAIIAMGKILAHLGDELGDEAGDVLALVMERLRNETTRMPALRTLAAVSESPLRLDMTPILARATGDLAQFLRQQSRALKQTTLTTLDALITANSGSIPPQLVANVVQEAAALVTDADLHLTQLSLRVMLSTLQRCPEAVPSIITAALPRALELAASPLLQGQALSILIQLLQELAASGAPGAVFADLITSLLSRADAASAGGDGQAALPRQAVANLAKCIAGLCVRADDATRQSTVTGLCASLGGDDDRRKHLALLSIGELGQQVDLHSNANLKDLILGCFESDAEETKTAAAFALGHLAVGNMDTYLPEVLSAMDGSRQRYLLLASLKEMIVVHANSGRDFGAYMDQVLPRLLEQCRSEEQGVRNMVAECLGALSATQPERIVPTLVQLASDDDNARWTTAAAVRFSLSRPVAAPQLAAEMDTFLNMLSDENLDVRRSALLMVNAAVHHHPEMISALVPTRVVPVLMETMDLQLARVVDLGPFKHKVDDGLPLRKAALVVADTILDSCPSRLDVGAFMPALVKGLGDSDEVKMLAHQVMVKVAALAPVALLGAVEALVPPLEKTVTAKIKEGQVGTEVERANELIRSGLRVVMALGALEEVAGTRSWTELMQRLHAKESVRNLLDSMRRDRAAEL